MHAQGWALMEGWAAVGALLRCAPSVFCGVVACAPQSPVDGWPLLRHGILWCLRQVEAGGEYGGFPDGHVLFEEVD